MAVGDPYVFPGFLTRVLTQLFFPKPPTTFLTCFCRGERQKYAGKPIFEFVQDFIQTSNLTEFHEYLTENVASRAYTRFFYDLM